MEELAPGRWTERAAAWLAKVMASASDALSLRREARAPRKQSPAPVGSRAWTVGVGVK